MDIMKEDQVKGNPAENIESMEFETTPTANETGGETGRKVMVMEWHTCGVCLEEMVDTDLLTHSLCGALLCGECLESSKQHTVKEDGRMPCPVSNTNNFSFFPGLFHLFSRAFFVFFPGFFRFFPGLFSFFSRAFSFFSRAFSQNVRQIVRQTYCTMYFTAFFTSYTCTCIQ